MRERSSIVHRVLAKNWNSSAMLASLISICLVVAGSGAIVTGTSVNLWYPTLRKPSWNPPSWVFGPVWTTLYVMMAIAAWLVWRKRDFDGARCALLLFAAQLALNAAWTPLFFGLKNPLAGLLDIIPLCVAILATTVYFWRVSAIAGMLLIPYWLWVCFATALNFTIWKLNR
jgi:benzodiazapine receptor